MEKDASDHIRTLINTYFISFNNVEKDLKICKKEGMEQSFAVDFSEIYAYMYKDLRIEKIGRKDYPLLDYIFSQKRDFKLTLLPAAIFEIINHYKTIGGVLYNS